MLLKMMDTMISFHFSIHMEWEHSLSLISWTCRSLNSSELTWIFFFELLPEIERPLEIPENDIEIPLWFRALKDDLRDVISVCSLHARLQRSQSARR